MKYFNDFERGRRALKALTAAVFVVAVFFAPSFALAHGGEDHGDEKATVTSSSGPRIEAHSKDFELVGIPSAQDGGKVVVYLNQFWSNEPLTGATIEMTRGDETVTATETKECMRSRRLGLQRRATTI